MFYFVFFCFNWFFQMAKATYAKNFRFFTSPWSVGLRQISCILCSNSLGNRQKLIFLKKPTF